MQPTFGRVLPALDRAVRLDDALERRTRAVGRREYLAASEEVDRVLHELAEHRPSASGRRVAIGPG